MNAPGRTAVQSAVLRPGQPNPCRSLRAVQRGRWSSRHHRRQRGTVLVVTLVCLLVITAMLGAVMLNTLRFRRQLLVERDLRQTELLLRAGIDRAQTRLRMDPNSRQESWHVPAEEILGSAAGSVEWSVKPATDGQPARLLVAAEYPLQGTPSVRRSVVLLLPVQISAESVKE